MGTSNNSFLLRTTEISAGGVARPNFALDKAIGYACGDFDLPPKPGKISHVLVTKAIFRDPFIPVRFEFGYFTLKSRAAVIRIQCGFIQKEID